MRLQLKSAWPKHPYEMLLPDASIIVRRKHRTLTWTWTDGAEYYVDGPIFQIGLPTWNIRSAGRILATGVMLHPTFRDTFLRAALHYIGWKIQGEVIREVPRCCSGKLRLSSGRRLAQWRIGKRIHIVCQDHHPSCHVAIILAMVLARVYDFDQ